MWALLLVVLLGLVAAGPEGAAFDDEQETRLALKRLHT